MIPPVVGSGNRVVYRLSTSTKFDKTRIHKIYPQIHRRYDDDCLKKNIKKVYEKLRCFMTERGGLSGETFH
jgi:hypothetical protein